MYVQVTPHIPKGSKAPTGLTLHVGSSQATVVFESNSKHDLAIKSLSYAKSVTITVSVPDNMSTKRKVGVWAQADADNTPVANASPSLSLTVKAKASSSKSSGSSKGSSSSSSSGSSSSSSTSDLPSGLGSSGAGATPSVAPSNDPAVLPSIAPTQTPSTAPVVNTGNSQQMRGTTDAADELTFDKLASTQAAWLAALLVAFSLLLTQVRLGRANARTPKQKGAHRKTHRSGGAH